MAQFEQLLNSKGDTLQPIEKMGEVALFKVQGSEAFFITEMNDNKLKETSTGWEQAGKYYAVNEKEARALLFKHSNGLPFDIPENPTSEEKQKAIKDYLLNVKNYLSFHRHMVGSLQCGTNVFIK
jgi:hypothetical protein